MSDAREVFEKLYGNSDARYWNNFDACLWAWQARQPEIDALKAEIARLIYPFGETEAAK